MITPSHLAKAYSYMEYRELINSLTTKEKTTGVNHSPKIVNYTKLNIQRMQRLDKTTVLNLDLVRKLQQVTEPLIWVVLTEAWCGDSAQNIPVIAKMADITPNITLKLLLRDENPDIMNDYLTNGSMSIPKLICLDADTLEEIGTWGPRPKMLQDMVIELRKNLDTTREALEEMIHSWYAKDKSHVLQAEFESLLQQWTQQMTSSRK